MGSQKSKPRPLNSSGGLGQVTALRGVRDLMVAERLSPALPRTPVSPHRRNSMASSSPKTTSRWPCTAAPSSVRISSPDLQARAGRE